MDVSTGIYNWQKIEGEVMKHSIFVFFLLVPLTVDRASAQNGISIRVGGSVEYVVTDPQQRREGVDPIANQLYREINSSYGEFSVDSEDPDVDPPEPVNEFMTHDPVDGFYRLTLFGTKLARYRFSIVVDAQNKGKSSVTFGTIDINQVRFMEFDYSSDSSKPFVLKKLITGTNLREDLNNCQKLGFLGGRSLFKELLEKAEHIENRLERSDSSKAYEEVEKFAKKLKKVRDETEKLEGKKPKSNRFITREAFDILSEDVAILMSSLSPRKHHKKDDNRRDKQEDDDRGNRKKSDRDRQRN